MKAESILVIFFAIAVMKINLGESRIYLRPIFWMMDPKDAVVNLKSYREVATIKRDPLELITPQDAIGFELAPQIENDEDPKDAVLDLKWYPFFKVRVMKKDPSQDMLLKRARPAGFVDLFPDGL